MTTLPIEDLSEDLDEYIGFTKCGLAGLADSGDAGQIQFKRSTD
jgi:hypothetical protein